MRKGSKNGKWSRRKPATVKGSARAALTSRQERELADLRALPDSQIDTSEIPELPASMWKEAIRGRFYRPVKQAISLRLDADVIAWLKKPGKGYQTRVNSILRQNMLADMNR
ncbi:MAG: BrnA antitoxin family protein [Terriglobales bacterium]